MSIIGEIAKARRSELKLSRTPLECYLSVENGFRLLQETRFPHAMFSGDEVRKVEEILMRRDPTELKEYLQGTKVFGLNVHIVDLMVS